MSRLIAFFELVKYHAQPRTLPPGESEARLTLYPTSRRHVQGASQKRPSAVIAASGAARPGEDPDGRPQSY